MERRRLSQVAGQRRKPRDPRAGGDVDRDGRAVKRPVRSATGAGSARKKSSQIAETVVLLADRLELQPLPGAIGQVDPSFARSSRRRRPPSCGVGPGSSAEVARGSAPLPWSAGASSPSAPAGGRLRPHLGWSRHRVRGSHHRRWRLPGIPLVLVAIAQDLREQFAIGPRRGRRRGEFQDGQVPRVGFLDPDRMRDRGAEDERAVGGPELVGNVAGRPVGVALGQDQTRRFGESRCPGTRGRRTTACCSWARPATE